MRIARRLLVIGAAADANGGAFNGLTLVGNLPDYKSQATVITVR